MQTPAKRSGEEAQVMIQTLPSYLQTKSLWGLQSRKKNYQGKLLKTNLTSKCLCTMLLLCTSKNNYACFEGYVCWDIFCLL
jgi:hypothetical protein